MTDRPLCQYVKHEEHGGSLRHSVPTTVDARQGFIDQNDIEVSCTRFAVIGYRDGEDNTVFGCEWHADIEILDSIGIPLPDGRNRPGQMRIG